MRVAKVTQPAKAAMKIVMTAAISLLMLTGCTSWGVSPWERQRNALDDHIYFSKEASSGGRSFGGGGCGCN